MTKSFVLWFTGLSGSGKSTLANAIMKNFDSLGIEYENLDGDAIRELFPEIGFTRSERDAHIKRVGLIAHYLEKHGIVPIVSLISPYIESRNFVRNLCSSFIEVYVSTSFEDCEKRDVKGLYRKARNGDIANFTGFSDPFEAPVNPEITIDTAKYSIDEAAEIILKYLGDNFGEFTKIRK
ncbi:MAG: adenylyl-sulfate kinase [Pseudomonadota bacterium]